MLQALSSRLTYANVTATVAVFLALGGGAFALSGIPDRHGVFRGCVNKRTHVLRVVTGAGSCRATRRRNGRNVDPGEFAVSWNQQGPRGLQGIQGSQGIPGPKGDNGNQAAIGVHRWAGLVTGTIAGSSSVYVFAGPTTTVTTNATQSVVASGSAALATNTSLAEVKLSICAQPTGGGTVTALDPTGGGAVEDVIVTTTRIPFGVSATGAPGVGTWNVGLCVDDFSSQAVNFNDWSIGWALVI